MFIGGTDVEAETPILWPPHAKSWLIGKDPDVGRDWGQEETGTTEDEMASLIQWTWIWVNSGSWCWTGGPGILWFMGSLRVGHHWMTELNWTEFRLDSSYSDWMTRFLMTGESIGLFNIAISWGGSVPIAQMACTPILFIYFYNRFLVWMRLRTFVSWHWILSYDMILILYFTALVTQCSNRNKWLILQDLSWPTGWACTQKIIEIFWEPWPYHKIKV